MKKLLITATLLAAGFTCATAAQAETIFHCTTKSGKQVQLDHSGNDMLTYRFGRNLGAPEITLRSPVHRAKGGSRNHHGASIEMVGLSNGSYTYYVQNSYTENGRRQGISVYKGNREISFIPCRGNARSNLDDVASRVIDTI